MYNTTLSKYHRESIFEFTTKLIYINIYNSCIRGIFPVICLLWHGLKLVCSVQSINHTPCITVKSDWLI